MSDNKEHRTIANRYSLRKKVGDGGMGNIFLADDLQLSRQVAVKTIRQELKENVEVRKRIDRECNLHATLGVHPNIIALHDKIVEDNDIFLIMEYVEGETLTTYLKKIEREKPQQNLKEKLSIVYQILEALAHIHDNDILHRDIKPSNIILSKKNNSFLSAKLMDFGIASLDREDSALTQLTTLDTGGPGTPAYMAPERIDSATFGESGPPTDLYSVGVILYELLGDGPPFQGTMTEVFTGHLAKKPNVSELPTSLPEALISLVQKSLEKEQSNRFQNAREFATALRAIDVDQESRRDTTTSQPDESLEQTLLATDQQREAIAEAVSLSQISTRKGGGFKWLAVGLALLCLAGLVWVGWHLLGSEQNTGVTDTPTMEKQKNTQEKVNGGSKEAKDNTPTSAIIGVEPETAKENNPEIVINPFSSPSEVSSEPTVQQRPANQVPPTLERPNYRVPASAEGGKSNALSVLDEIRKKNKSEAAVEKKAAAERQPALTKTPSYSPPKINNTPPKTKNKTATGWTVIKSKTKKVE